MVYATGSFAGVSGGVAFPDGVARYNGSAWTTIGIDTPAISGTINASLATPDGSLYLVYSGTGNSTAEGVTVVTNLGTAKTYPTVIIKGPSSGTARNYSIVNYTTNRAIYLNLTISAGETVKLVLTPDNLSFVSDTQGPIASVVLPGSNEADFFLQPGANSIAFFSASSTVTATIQWRPAYASIDDVP
jgi:Phage tail protein